MTVFKGRKRRIIQSSIHSEHPIAISLDDILVRVIIYSYRVNGFSIFRLNLMRRILTSRLNRQVKVKVFILKKLATGIAWGSGEVLGLRKSTCLYHFDI
jgi:hypothetical protein